MKHFLEYLRARMRKSADQAVLTDHQGTVSYTYRSMARTMTQINQLLDHLNIQAGDRVALCGRNSSNWGVAFMTLMASRRIAVSILPDFTPEGIRELVNHSEAKALFVGDSVWKSLTSENSAEQLLELMPDLQAIIGLSGWKALALRDEKDAQYFSAETEDTASDNLEQQLDWWQIGDLNEICVINYTSGTTSSPKGVMLTAGSISSNVEMVFTLVDNVEGKDLVSILPLAHMYGLVVEFISCIIMGVHVHFILKNPTPSILSEALSTVRPVAMVCVPLVLEKVFRKKVLPMVKKPYVRVLLALPGIGSILKKKIVSKILNAMGGNMRYFVIGGAAINQEVETWMHRLGLPYIVGYGMTECGPLIAVSRVGEFAPYSCGKAVQRMEIKIDSEDPEHVDGEILVKGDNVMLGYYKNEEATRATFTQDGWMRTGDLGIFNAEGDLYIRGRSKNMILGASGQNIYPEELEDKVNSLPGVVESIVVDRNGHLTALIYADPIYQRRLGKEKLEDLIRSRMKRINRQLPQYSQIHAMEFVAQEFEKTPKRSIKRYLYN